MVPTYEQMGDWLEEIAGGSPTPSFWTWTGASSWRREPCLIRTFPPARCTLWESMSTICWGGISSCITGSFAALLPEEDEEGWKDEIFATVAHEFTHHLEETAGLHALDDKDAEFLRQALEEYGEEKK